MIPQLEMMDVMGTLYGLFPLPFTDTQTHWDAKDKPTIYTAELVTRDMRDILRINELLDMENLIVRVLDSENTDPKQRETYHIFRKDNKAVGTYEWKQGTLISRSRVVTLIEKVKMEDVTPQITRYRRIQSVFE